MSKLQNLVVDSPSKIGNFENTLKSGKVSFVLVYGEWCGACKRFRKNVWNPMLKRKALHNRIELRDDMVKKSPISSNWKFDYLPSLIVVDEKGVAQTFQQPDGSMKNAMRTPKDVKEMTRIVNVPVQPLPSLSQQATPEATPEEEVEYENEDYENDEEEQEEAINKNKNINTLLANASASEDKQEEGPVINLRNMTQTPVNNRKITQPPVNNISPNNNINTLLAKANKAPFANARNSLNLAMKESPLTNEDIIPTKEVVTSTGKIYVPTRAVAPQLGGSLLRTMTSYVRSQRRKGRKTRGRKIDGKRRTRK